MIEARPNHLVVMVGINDVARHFSAGEHRASHVPLPEFIEIYERLIERSREANIPSIRLCGCFFVEPNRREAMRMMCDDYNSAVANFAKRKSLPFIDLQGVFDRLMEHQHPMAIAADRVHPQLHGHMAIAEEIYRNFARA